MIVSPNITRREKEGYIYDQIRQHGFGNYGAKRI